jgi:formate-dependent phosphoribosylglycinamide formyltransferase (GAR transformylase)
MKAVVFVAPVLLENTQRYVRAFAEAGCRLGIISQDSIERLDAGLRPHVHAAVRVRNVMDPDDLVAGCEALSTRLGGLDRLAGALEQLQIPLGIARDRLRIGGMGEEVARNFREKARMKDLLSAANVPVARHKLAKDAADVRAFVARVGYPVIVKPPDGLGAKATFRVSDRDDLEAALRVTAPSPQAPVQVEEFIRAAEENTCETVSIRGVAVWRSGTRYLPSVLDVVENPWMQYCVLLPREDQDPRFVSFHPINDRALRALGMQTGLTHMEWFRMPDGSALVNEVGARPPGASIMPLMSQTHDCDMWQRWASLVVHETFDPPVRKYAAGVAFFRGTGTGAVSAIRGLDAAQEAVGALVMDRKLPVVGQPKSASYEGEGWALVRHPDTRVVYEALRTLISLVRVEYA